MAETTEKVHVSGMYLHTTVLKSSSTACHSEVILPCFLMYPSMYVYAYVYLYVSYVAEVITIFQK